MPEISMPVGDIFYRVLIIFSLLLFGLLARRFNLIKEEAQSSLAEIVISIAIPAIMFVSIVSNEGRGGFSEWYLAPLISIIVIFLLLFISKICGCIFHLPPKLSGTFLVVCAIPNTAFIGFPVVLSLLDKEGLTHAVLYDFGASIILWTVVVTLLQGDGFSLKNWKNILNPVLGAIIAGFIINTLKIKVPSLIIEALNIMGNAAVPLAMLLVGYQLAGLKLRFSTNGIYLGVVVLIKLFLFPFVTYILMSFLNLDPVLRAAVLIESAMPSMASTPVLVKKFGGDLDFATASVFITTLLSTITIPLILYLLL